MSPARIHWHVFLSVTLAYIAAAWVGCAKQSVESPTWSSSTSTGSPSGSGGSGGIGGDVGFDGGGGDDSDACASTEEEAHRITVDMIFVIDQSGSMAGAKWTGTTSGLSTFFNDPASIGIGAGLVLFPKADPYDCDPTHFAALDVPINLLPANAFALTNALPFNATGATTPTYGALYGALMAATAYQDSHPTHKVVVVLATDGAPNGCGGKTNDQIAALAQSARNYNGVRTYVIGVEGSIIANLDQIAVAGGTTAAYDITQDISVFSAKIAEIRNEALGCDFELPPPPNGMALESDQVNFTYTPNGMGTPKLLPRADDLADCNGQPGWYYDSNAAPTKMILCPASCATVQADDNAKVLVLFGCNSVIN